MNSSRRQFFSLLKDALTERLQSALKDVTKTEPVTDPWRRIGIISDFPVNTYKTIQIDGSQIAVSSDHDGIFVENNEGTRLPLMIRERGEIAVNINEVWPKNAVISILTSEMKLV